MPPRRSRVQCDICSKTFANSFSFARHWRTVHTKSVGPQVSENLVAAAAPKSKRQLRYIDPGPDSALPPVEQPLVVPSVADVIAMGYEQPLVDEIRSNWRFLATCYRSGNIMNRYNFRLPPDGVDLELLGRLLLAVHNAQDKGYKFNIHFGIILYNQVENKFRFFWAGNSAATAGANRYYAEPKYVHQLSDVEKCIEQWDYNDIINHVLLNRMDSKWTLYSIVSFHVLVYKILTAAPLMGAVPSNLPDFLTKSRYIRTMHRNTRGNIYRDNMCLWRCLAVHLSVKRGRARRANRANNPRVTSRLNEKAIALSRLFSLRSGVGDVPYTSGISVEQMLQIERLFLIRIFVLELRPKEEAEQTGARTELAANVVRRSRLRAKTQINGDLYLNLHRFGGEASVEHLSLITNISAVCHFYYCSRCGMHFRRAANMRQHERNCGCSVGERARCPGGGYASDWNVFQQLKSLGIDFDSDLCYTDSVSTFDIETLGLKLGEGGESNRASNSLSSSSSIVWEKRLEIISCAVATSCPGFQRVTFFKRTSTEQALVAEIISHLLAISSAASQLNRSRLAGLFDSIDGEIETSLGAVAHGDTALKDYSEWYVGELTGLRKRLEQFADRHSVFSFCGSRFDLKAIKSIFVCELMRQDSKIESIIKRDSSYVLVATEQLVFKDVACFIGVGSSLDSWARSMGLTVSKAAFPHDMITSLDVLEQSEFPEHYQFYSTLKNDNISKEQYDELRAFYIESGFTCLWSFLSYYNGLDAELTLQGVQRLQQIWRDQANLDMPSDAVSLPGLACKLLDSKLPATRPIIFLPSKQHIELYSWALPAVVGGPSICFKQLSCAGVSRIGQGEKLCRSIRGFDANSLYLHCLSKPLPGGIAADWRRTEPNGIFHKRVCLPNHVSFAEAEFTEYLRHCVGEEESKFLFTFFNRGQKRLSRRKRFTPDAISFRLRRIWNFDGCWFHLCNECMVGRRAAATNPVYAEKRRKEDALRDSFLSSIGYHYEVVRECFWQLKRQERDVADFLRTTLHTPLHGVQNLSEKQLLAAIRSKEFFGLVEVDIFTPDSLLPYFSDVPPLYCHFTVERRHISEEMLKLAEDRNLLRQGRKTLVSVCSANRIILTTPLICWLLDKGLVCSRIHRAVEFKEFKFYEKFADCVVENRRLSDQNESMASLGNFWKLSGNSAYGRTIIRYDRFLRCQILDDAKTSKVVNRRNFRHLEPLHDGAEEAERYYEVDTLPRQYTEKSPRFLDSWYLGLSEPDWPSLERKIKPELWEKYLEEKPKFLASPETLRKAGVFKEEYSGELIVCLNSKCYCIVKTVTQSLAERCRKLLEERTKKDYSTPTDVFSFADGIGGQKLSSKGTNKKLNTDVLCMDRYLSVLETGESIYGQNKGFTYVAEKGMQQFTMRRISLQRFYIKRHVNADFSTRPLF